MQTTENVTSALLYLSYLITRISHLRYLFEWRGGSSGGGDAGSGGSTDTTLSSEALRFMRARSG